MGYILYQAELHIMLYFIVLIVQKILENSNN
jgi:hypothetical protein